MSQPYISQTVPPQIPQPAPLPPLPQTQVPAKKASAGIDNGTIFFITLGIHGVLIGIELYLAYKSGWLTKANP